MATQQKKRENGIRKAGNGNGNGGKEGERKPQRPKFEVGKEVHVWKLTGVRDMKNGPSSSEKPGGDYPDIRPEEKLIVLEKHGVKAKVEREDGSQIFVHINHVWRGSKYYEGRKAEEESRTETKAEQAKPSARETVRARIESARKAYEEAFAELEQASEDLPYMLEEEEDQVANVRH